MLRRVLLVLAGFALGVGTMLFIPLKKTAPIIQAELGMHAKPGPWGELYYVPFVISAPEEVLPVRTIESGGTHWLFKNSTISEISHLLEAADMPSDLRDAMLAPAVAQFKGIDLELTPTPDMVASLPGKARAAIYRKLAQFPENRSAIFFIHKDTLSFRFEDSGLTKETRARFEHFCCEHGDYLVFGGLPAMLALIPSYEEKLRFVKALTRQKTMLIRLSLTKDSDPKRLSEYWGKGAWAPNVLTILDSIEKAPGATFVTVMALLPPMPSGLVYFYPTVQNNPLNGSAAIRDCHWTSLNFFRDISDTRAVDSASFVKTITEDYFPITGDPRYGDILVFAKPDGEIIHSAVFIADEIVFTKNGSTAIFPWMFSTVTDLMNQYSFLAPEGQRIVLRYFRNKGA